MTDDAIRSESRDSWIPRLPSWARSALVGAAGALLPILAGGLIAWGALGARADSEAERVRDVAAQVTKVAADAVAYRDLTSARVGALEVRQAEQGAQYDALHEGQQEIKESLRRLEDRFGTRRGDDDDD